MVQIPLASSTVAFTAPSTGVAIPAPNTQIWDKLGDWAYKLASEEEAKAGQAQGIRDQAEQKDGKSIDVGFLGKLFPRGQGYQAGVDQQFAVQKQVDLSGKIADLQKQFPTDPKGFATAFEAVKKDWLKDVRPDIVGTFAGAADNIGLQSVRQIEAAGVQREMQTRAASLLDTAEKLRTQIHDGIVSGTLSQTEIDDRQAQLSTLIQAGVQQGSINPLAARELIDQAGATIRKADILAAFRKNMSTSFIDAVRDAKENMPGEAGRGTLTPEQRQQLVSQMNGEWNQAQHRAAVGAAAAATTLRTQVNDDLASRATTGVPILTEAQVRAAFPRNPAAADEAVAKQRMADQSYTFTQQIGLTSAAEDAAMLEKMKPAPGSAGYADTYKMYGHAQQVVAQKWQTIASDPAQYVASVSPEIRALINSNDAGERNAGIATMLEIQRRMGISEGAQAVMPKAQAQQMAADLSVLPAEDAANRIAALASQYGDNFPILMRQMARLEHPLSPSYQVLATMTAPQDAQARADLASALKLGDKQLKDNLDKSKPGVIGDVDREVQKALLDFNKTAIAQGGDRLVNVVGNAASSLAYLYASRGMSPADAAQAAAKAIVGRYDYVGTMRVPKGAAADTEAAGEYLKSTISPDRLEPVPARPGEPLTPEQRMAVQYEALKRARWITNADDTGAILVYENGQPVRLKSDGSVAAPGEVAPGSPNADPAVQGQALAKRRDVVVDDNPARAARVESAMNGTRKPDDGYRRVEFLWRDAKELALSRRMIDAPVPTVVEPPRYMPTPTPAPAQPPGNVRPGQRWMPGAPAPTGTR